VALDDGVDVGVPEGVALDEGVVLGVWDTEAEGLADTLDPGPIPSQTMGVSTPLTPIT
jgi:hypothetical protein